MPPIFAKRIMVWIVSVSLLGTSLPTASYAGIIGTETLVKSQQTDNPRARVEEVISRASVRAQLMALGADPAEVSGRLAALTDEELRELEQNIDTMPAGGILAVIGITFVVLLILEFTGTTDIFKKV
ncbi:MAG: PA2779 family protein [Gammaproteobacteria bacterium]